MTRPAAVPPVLVLAGVQPDDTEQLIVVMPRPSSAEAMADLTAALKVVRNLAPQRTATLIQHDGDSYVVTGLSDDV